MKTASNVADDGFAEPARQIGLAAGARHQRPRFLDRALGAMDHVAEQTFAFGYRFHHGPEFGREMIQARIDAGERYFTDWSVVAALVDFESPGAGLQFTASHEFVDDGICIAERSIPVRQLDPGRVLHVAAAVAQSESVDRHRPPLIRSGRAAR